MLVAMYLFLLLLATLVALFGEDYYRRKRSERYVSKKMPTLPIIGSAFLFFSENFLNVFMEYSKKFKEPYYFRVCLKDHYYTQNADEIKEILTSPKTIEKGFIYSFLQWAIPDTILIVHEAVWRKKRRCLSRGFNQRRLNALVPCFDRNAGKLVEKLHEVKDVPMLELIERNIIDSYMETMIGLKVDEADEEIRELYKEVDMYTNVKMVEASALKRYFKPWLYPDFVYLHTREGKTLSHKLSCYNDLVKHIVQERKKLINTRGNEYVDDVEKNLIDLMVEANLSEKDMLVETMLFGAGATETTGVVLALTFTLLGMFPDIQEKVYQEILSVAGDGHLLDHNDLVKLKYTEMVLYETMRRFPPVPLIIRLATADLDLGTRTIPANTNIMISIVDVQHSERYWKDPLKFDPDRFAPEEVEKRPPSTFLAFSAGPRNCIGLKFSMILMKTILVNVVREFRLSSKTKSTDDIKMDSRITAVVKQGLDCTMTPRNSLVK